MRLKEKAAQLSSFSGVSVLVFYLLVSFTASFRSPATLWAEPFALSSLPSDCNFCGSFHMFTIHFLELLLHLYPAVNESRDRKVPAVVRQSANFLLGTVK